MTSTWNGWLFFSQVFSVALYVGFLFAYSTTAPGDALFPLIGAYPFLWVPENMFRMGGFWASAILVPIAVFVVDFSIVSARIEFATSDVDRVRERELIDEHGWTYADPCTACCSSRAADNNHPGDGAGSGGGGGAPHAGEDDAVPTNHGSFTGITWTRNPSVVGHKSDRNTPESVLGSDGL